MVTDVKWIALFVNQALASMEAPALKVMEHPQLATVLKDLMGTIVKLTVYSVNQNHVSMEALALMVWAY